MGLMDELKPGVLVGEDVIKLLDHAKKEGYAIPAFNCTSSSTINACMEAAAKTKSPIMIQVSNGGGVFYAGKFLDNTNQRACIAGSLAAAHHVHQLAELYGIPVVLHTDHCAKKLLPWFDGMMDVNEQYFKAHGKPLFSSHMLDLSEEPLEEILEYCEKYLTRMAKMGITLELEIGITGGEEDGVDNSGIDKEKLYTHPDDVWQVYKRLSPISHRYTVAASFGNVHGVYSPGNVVLKPEILGDSQKYVREKIGPNAPEKPMYFVFHGGSGSEKGKIATALQHGVVKMNVDTDTQWAYWSGLLEFYKAKEGYLQGQIGNPDGPEKPNKKFYDPRVWIRKCEESMIKRIVETFEDLNCKGKLA
jgi:fructose-bisphosphate aldolase class II|eukprot:CAMPEP_0174283244 /NCGR_PEP_ID=MMETSP0809-20121228/3894_1 /TAXON_ID=73025 ORGANISM="Eutreptiella gymnastica-like, Strain CCMP1594" /NCGR_SAMPLE_ID=MMETSP0809 /ASSEMBLY_ACC=CAM_ASM_000658 /LENGTH=360 /DNA_ID=CAMNT_0015378033 /DNA_START=57 /DNA_END=1139 /DNA_ORIENTATION=-